MSDTPAVKNPPSEHRAVEAHITSIGWRPLMRTLFGVALLLLVLVIVRELADVLKTIVIATFLAIAADAVTRRVQGFGFSRGMAITFVLGGSVLAGLLVVVLLVAPLVNQATDLVDAAPDIVSDFEDSALWKTVSDALNLQGDGVPEKVTDILIDLPQLLAEFIMDVVGGIFGLVTLFIAVAFLLAGGSLAIRLLVRLVPRASTPHGWAVIIGAYNNIGRYLTGATLQALCAGVSLTLVLVLLGTPYALALGMFMLIMDYIPLVGATIGSVPAVAVALFTGGWFDGIMVLAFLVVYQQIENTIIQPRIQGHVVQLPGIAIFFSVLVGGELLGVLGALIAVPIASIVQIIVKQVLVASGRDQIELPQLFDDAGRPILEYTPVVAAEDHA